MHKSRLSHGLLTLFIHDEVLSTSNYVGILDANNSVGESNTRHIRVDGEAFPVTATSGHATQRTSSRSKENINTLVMLLLAHLLATVLPEMTAPRGTGRDADGEGTRIVGEANAQRSVLKAETTHAQPRNRSNVTDASLAHPPKAPVLEMC
jgi:hypothetical protein